MLCPYSNFLQRWKNAAFIERETSPKEAWRILKQLYGGAGPNKLVSLLHKLVSTKIEHFHSCDEYITTVVQAAYDLQDTDFGILLDPVLVAFLLAGLNDDYESLRQSVDQSLEKVTSEEVKNRIRDTWARINKRQQDVDSVPGFFRRKLSPTVQRRKLTWPRL